MLDVFDRYFTMFKKNKKRPEISNPLNFEHRVHTGFDSEHGKYVGLPPQWMGIIIPDQETERRKPMVDPSTITDMDIQPLKVNTSTPNSTNTCSDKAFQGSCLSNIIFCTLYHLVYIFYFHLSILE